MAFDRKCRVQHELKTYIPVFKNSRLIQVRKNAIQRCGEFKDKRGINQFFILN